MKLSATDLDALVRRNRIVTDAFHTVTPRLILRRRLLQALSMMPISRCKTDVKERILLIRPDHLGDLILTTPAIRALRLSKPHAEIHALVGPWAASVLENNTDVDAVLTLEFPGFKRGEKPPIFVPYREALHTARKLRRLRYSSAFILRSDHWWGAMVAFLAGIPTRIGHSHPNTATFLTHAVQVDEEHAVYQSARLVSALMSKQDTEDSQLVFNYHEADRNDVNVLLQTKGISPDQRIFCIHPGSGTWVKRWNATRWAVVADTLIDQLNAAVVITGSSNESHLAQDIINRMDQNAVNLAGQTNLGQLAALFSRSLVVLGPDSGPMHLAAAVNTPTVALFGPADPDEFAPWGPSSCHVVLTSDIGCRPCRVLDWGDDPPENHPCVHTIPIGQVLEAARRVAKDAPV